MKKLVYISAVASALAFGGIVWANGDGNPNGTRTGTAGTPVPAVSHEEFLSFEEASAKALDVANGIITDIEFERGGLTPHYEVDIDYEGYEYDVKIDAQSGEVLEQKREKEDRDENFDDEFAASQPASKEFISSEDAVKAAQTVAEGTVEKVELENEDGMTYYEVKLENGRTEYEIYVNAVSGEILKQEQDELDDNDND